MGLTDIPTSFGSSFFIRTFFPASIATVIYSVTFYDVLKNSFWFALSFENKIIVLIIISLLIGILLNIFDFYIYQSYEGISGLLNFDLFKNLLYRRQIEKLKKINNDLNIIEKQISDEKDEIKLQLLKDKELQLYAELRKFPYDRDKSKRYVENPTEFGNVIAEYELYSETQYGMHMMVFWQHLWFILPKDLRDDLDLRSAKADFSVYVSFILLTFAFIGTAGFIFQSNNSLQYFWWIILLLKALILLVISIFGSYLFYRISISEHKISFILLTFALVGTAEFIFQSNNSLQYFWWIILSLKALILFLISIFGSYLFYRISISEHKTYGRYIKAVFDSYRFDLETKLNIKISKSPEIEKKSWKKWRGFFLDYLLPDR